MLQFHALGERDRKQLDARARSCFSSTKVSILNCRGFALRIAVRAQSRFCTQRHILSYNIGTTLVFHQ